MSDASLTQRELEILQNAWHCFQSPDALKIDTEKLAKRCGMSNPKSASNAWAAIKKKLASAQSDEAIAANGDDSPTPKATPTKATPKKRGPAKAKAKTPEETEGGDLADTEKTPSATSPITTSKPTRKRKASEITDATTSLVKEENDAQLDGNGEGAATETPEKKKRAYVRKPKTTKAAKHADEDNELSEGMAKLVGKGNKRSKADQEAYDDTVHAIKVANANDDATFAENVANAQMEEADDEGRTFDEEEQQLVNEQLATLTKRGETVV